MTTVYRQYLARAELTGLTAGLKEGDFTQLGQDGVPSHIADTVCSELKHVFGAVPD